MRASLTLLLLLHAPGLALAAPRAEAALDGDDPRAVVTLLADREAVAPGERVRVGVRFELDPGWHVYWRNPGQAAFATSVIFEGDLAVGPLRWPAPHRFEAPGPIVTYGYGEQVLLFAEA
ncbi:MAG: protein-disulfide reductase DsbD domain-containing protein, partial [Myxococcota bacterium]